MSINPVRTLPKVDPAYEAMWEQTVKPAEVLVSSKVGYISVDHEAQGLRLEFTDVDSIDDYINRLVRTRNQAFPHEESIFKRRNRRRTHA